MSNDWTAERLNALSVDTVITELEFGVSRFVRDDSLAGVAWVEVGGDGMWSSAELAADCPAGFRVVAVPYLCHACKSVWDIHGQPLGKLAEEES